MVQSATAALVAFGKYGEEGPVAAQLPAGCVCVKHVQLAVRVSSVCVCACCGAIPCLVGGQRRCPLLVVRELEVQCGSGGLMPT